MQYRTQIKQQHSCQFFVNNCLNYIRTNKIGSYVYIEKDNINSIEEYNLSDIEDKLFYFNIIDRSWHMHKNENSSVKYNYSSTIYLYPEWHHNDGGQFV